MGLVFANVPQAQAIRWAVEVSSKIFDCVDVMAYGIFRKVTTLELFQHHFAKSGHGDGLLMTRQLISIHRQPPLHYLTRSVRRTSGFVLARYPLAIGQARLHRGKRRRAGTVHGISSGVRPVRRLCLAEENARCSI